MANEKDRLRNRLSQHTKTAGRVQIDWTTDKHPRMTIAITQANGIILDHWYEAMMTSETGSRGDDILITIVRQVFGPKTQIIARSSTHLLFHLSPP